MKKILYTIALSLLSVASSHARIGETTEQCDSRYGKALQVESQGTSLAKRSLGKPVEQRIYKFKKFLIVLTTIDGTCEYIVYVKTGATDTEYLPLSEEEVMTLLKANKNDEKWSKLSSNYSSTTYHAFGYTAVHSKSAGLAIASLGFTMYEKARSEEEEKKKKLETQNNLQGL